MNTPDADTIDLAVIPGDGIGPEVTAEALKVLEAAAPAGVKIEPTRYDLGAERYLATGEVLPDSVLAEIRDHDAILLGAVGGKPGDPNLPAGHPRARPAAAAALRARPLREPAPVPDLPGCDLTARRTRARSTSSWSARAPRVPTPATAAPSGSGRRTRSPPRSASTRRTASSGSCATRSPGPQRRPRKKLTLVHKTNVLVHAGAVWCRLVDEVAQEFPDVTVDYLHVDAATIFMTTDPARFDVIVTDNLFGDIITDLAAAITGGIGLAASGNINPDRTAPSMFEPVHGSAPDIAGQQKADPTAAILSTRLLLDHLGLADAAAAVERAVIDDLAERVPGASRATPEVGDAIAARARG